jgi:tRNA A-37 threonylcarbamoyl transferase component Bud32
MPTTFACPRAEILERLLLGQITQEETDSLEAHILACTHCARTLQALNPVDTLVEAMREVRTQPQTRSSEAAAALIPWLKRLRPKDATQTMAFSEATAGTLPMASVLPTYYFLAAAAEPDELGRLAHYRVLQPIGVGGMGMVFLAQDIRLKRQVALKVIKPELLQREDLHARFLNEAQAIATVEHDNIVAIYEANEVSGVPYIVMPLLRGESLEHSLKSMDGPLPIDAILRVGREIAAGLEAAHQKGLIHRDIKPSNLWLETRDEGRGTRGENSTAHAPALAPRPSSLAPRVKILDFGLARSVEAVDEDGQQRTILGTPAYMAPEQACGLPSDARSDLFSLGCVMYRMATGRVPFKGRDMVTTLLSVATETPVPPKQLNPALPVDVAALIEKLLAKKPDERYASAQQVVEVIQAIERKRQPKRYGRWLLVTAACVGLAMLVTYGVLSYIYRPLPPVEITLEYDEPDTILLIQGEDEPEREIDIRQAPRQLLTPGTYALRPKHTYEKRQLMPDNIIVAPNEPRVVPLRLTGLIRPYDGHTSSITSVAFAPGKDSYRALTTSIDRSLGLWDTRADADVLFLDDPETQTKVHCGAFAPDGKRAISGSGMAHPRQPDNTVRIWDIDTRTCIARLSGHDSAVLAVAWDPKGKVLLSGDQDGIVIFWDAQTHKRIQAAKAFDRSNVHGLAFLPDGKQALFCGSDGMLVLGDVEKRTKTAALKGHKAAVTAVAACPDGKHAASSSDDGTIRVWDLAAAKSLQVLQGHEKSTGVYCVAYSPDGKRLLSGGGDKTVRLWNADTGELIHTLFGHHGAVRGVAFSADGRRAVSGGLDRRMCLWELPK